MISIASAAEMTDGVVPAAQLGGEEREHRADALAAGVEQVAARDVGEVVA